MNKLLAAVVLLALAFQATAQRAASPGNGQVVYLRAGCYACHGTVGHGGAGTRLAPNTLPLAAFQIWVRNGTPGWNIASGMPAFSAAVVTDDELADVRAFLASLPAPRAADDIPLLR